MKHVILIFAVALLFSFTKRTNAITGTYAVSSGDPSQIELVLTADQHFTYRDYSDQQNKINVSGSWALKGNKVVLTATEKGVRFHDKWSLSADQNSVHARKGLCWYSLCRME